MADLTERLLALIWKRRPGAIERLVTEQGDMLRVIYPGKENKDSGPDFVGATIATVNGELLTGDIELHLKSSDWKGHGHHRDPRYNGVILQAVWEGEEEAVLQNGKRVPTVSLSRYFDGSWNGLCQWIRLDMAPSDPCYNARQQLGDNEISSLLDAAGERRFQLKASSFAARLNREPPDQVLYQGIMGALGYTKNKEPFEELACRLPLTTLEGFCRGRPQKEQVSVLKNLLLGMAGLLPDGRSSETMSPSCWRLFRVRPENHPARRLIGAAHLLARFIEGGLVQEILHLVEKSCSDSDIGGLETGFMVEGDCEHCLRAERSPIGRGRAREIVINIVLPFTFAWASANLHTSFAEQVIELYRIYPRAEENEIIRGMRNLLGLGTSTLVNPARRQQGLIHLAKNFCWGGRCEECPLARRLN